MADKAFVAPAAPRAHVHLLALALAAAGDAADAGLQVAVLAGRQPLCLVNDGLRGLIENLAYDPVKC